MKDIFMLKKNLWFVFFIGIFVISMKNKTVNNYLYAPWRNDYGTNTNPNGECYFCYCVKNQGSQNFDSENFILKRYDHCFVIMNFYPYNKGHIMVIPYCHESQIYNLNSEQQKELIEVVAESTRILQDYLKVDGINVGINFGKVSGASIPSHLHVHLVPRFNGDTGFMEIIFDTRVIGAPIKSIYEILHKGFNSING